MFAHIVLEMSRNVVCCSTYSELLVEHCLIFFPDATEICELVLGCVVQVTLQLLQG